MILLAEDDDKAVSLIRRVLKKQSPSTTIHVARDGEEALDAMESRHAEPLQLIVLDLHLPTISGLEVLQKLRENAFTRHTPVITLSSSQDAKDVAKSYDLGANSFLGKSDKTDEFEDTVKQVIAYWLQLNHPCIHPGVTHR